jgi:hypothetical protein
MSNQLYVEVYYGYYIGDSPVWDTIIIKVPKDIDDADAENYASMMALEEVSKTIHPICFIGILNTEMEEEEV